MSFAIVDIAYICFRKITNLSDKTIGSMVSREHLKPTVFSQFAGRLLHMTWVPWQMQNRRRGCAHFVTLHKEAWLSFIVLVFVLNVSYYQVLLPTARVDLASALEWLTIRFILPLHMKCSCTNAGKVQHSPQRCCTASKKSLKLLKCYGLVWVLILKRNDSNEKQKLRRS